MKTNGNTSAGAIRLGAVAAAWVATLMVADAGARRFTYSYEATTMPQGHREYETWVTWKTDADADQDFERFDIRHEFEFGVTDRLQLALYLLDWRYEESATEDGKADFHDVAVEAIYGLTDPVKDWIGSAVYGEVKVGDGFLELESKLILQKDIGPWAFVYNIGGAIEWEDSYEHDEAELVQSAGVSYLINPSWSVGVEGVHECGVEDVEDFGDNAAYAGPNITYRSSSWWVAVSGLFQLTDIDDEGDFQLRTIVALDF